MEDIEKLVKDRLQGLRVGGDLEDALRKEVDQVNSDKTLPKFHFEFRVKPCVSPTPGRCRDE